MLRKLITAGIIGASAAATMVAAPAQAAGFDCPASNICLYTERDFGGDKQAFSGFVNYTDVNSRLHDNASSWGSNTKSQMMCVIDWVDGRQVQIGWLPHGNRTVFAGGLYDDRSDAVGWC